MKAPIWAVILACAILQPAESVASPYEPEEEEEGHYTSPTYRFFDTRERAQTAMHRDMKFADEMGQHHEGAVEMSEAYLHDPRGTNFFLQNMARAIIHNQDFEITWLKDLRQRVSAGPQPMLQLGANRIFRLPGGLTGLEHRARFQKAPILTVQALLRAGQPSEYDVMFAKAMKMHHQMGVEMAHEYNIDPAGGNRVIREINRGIIRDQKVEIGILNGFIARYPGDPDAVKIEPEMQKMMEMPQGDMSHEH